MAAITSTLSIGTLACQPLALVSLIMATRRNLRIDLVALTWLLCTIGLCKIFFDPNVHNPLQVIGLAVSFGGVMGCTFLLIVLGRKSAQA